ncbi:MAG TPA: ABC transporter permease [Verrucomicrobiae bacterium]|nr:ABC transporter permease [Verrucomicrobiae bacterium]
MWLTIKHAFRVLTKDPLFTGVAICSLALGIGATSAMYSFADEMLLRPLPVLNPDRVVTINTAVAAPFGQNPPISYPDYADLRDRNRTFDGLVAASYAFLGFSPDAVTQPRTKWGLYVSGNFFRVLGVEPTVGRGFRPDEDQVEGRDPVVVLGHDFWAGQFAANPSVVGSRIRLNGIEFRVIGVAPGHFTGIDTVFRPQLFVPLAMFPRRSQKNYLHDREFGWLVIKGRLKPDVGLEQAQADIAALSAALEKLHSPASRKQRLQVETEYQFRMAQGPTQMAMVAMLVLLGICVLLVACANVAGLLLSRARARAREIAVRLAIGASRAALVKQLLVENLLVAVAGGLAALVVADGINEFWRHVPVPVDLPVLFDVKVDYRVLLFTMIVSVLSTLLFGLAPALSATRPNLVPALKAADADSGGKHRFWGRNTIVAGQVALSLVLLAVSATLFRGFRNVLTAGPGFRTDHLFLTSFDTQLANYSPDQSQRFYQDLLDRTRAASGVKSAALISSLPMIGSESESARIVPEGWQLPAGEHSIGTPCASISDGYFPTMGIPILEGRAVLETDRENTPLVAVVNEHMAHHYWRGSAVGKRFQLKDTGQTLVEVVGVAKMAKYLWAGEAPQDFVYLPYRQHTGSKFTLVAESQVPDAGAIAPALRQVVRGLDPDMPVFYVRTMHDSYTQSVKPTDYLTEVVGAMGVMGMILAMVGLYGLVAYSVSRRRREIGIRMALGADRQSVVWMVLRQGLRLGVAGVAAGLVAAFGACRAITSDPFFYAFKRVDPLVLIAIPLLLLTVTVLATWAPARHAARVDPLTSLRDE